ncbi:hypothetical protein K7432_004784 [Basidiobolus ranarum]|uniref:Carbohydrate-binding domain-containing protein n=1 Tax=Basidiobolus ranarum TaxID=34480 RepID=A0ABR2WXR9_9FUNG
MYERVASLLLISVRNMHILTTITTLSVLELLTLSNTQAQPQPQTQPKLNLPKGILREKKLSNYLRQDTICELPVVKHYPAPYASQPPIIDGRLDDPVWNNAQYTDDFQDLLHPTSLVPINLLTRTKISWDDRFIYVGATLFDPLVSANVTKLEQYKNNDFIDNTFEIYIDLDRTNQHYKRIQVNPLGIVKTTQYSKPETDGGKVTDWNVGHLFQIKVYTPEKVQIMHEPLKIMNSKPTLNSFWSVEMAIPITSLSSTWKRAPSSQGPYSGFNFMRTGWPPKTVNQNEQRNRKRVNVEVFDSRYQYIWNRGVPTLPGTISNPDSWGTIYFSKETQDTCFKSDPQATIRYLLSQIYHAQWTYHKLHGYFAKDFVSLPPLINCTSTSKVSIVRDGSGFRASVAANGLLGLIRQDRLTWFENR